MSRSERPYLPEQPSIPLPLHALVALSCGVVGRAYLPQSSLPALAVGVTLVCVLLVTWSFVRGERDRLPLMLCWMAIVVLGWTMCDVRLDAVDAAARALAAQPVSTWELEAISDPATNEYGVRCRARARADGVDAEVWLSCSEPLGIGSRIRCVGVFAPNDVSDWGKTSSLRGISGSVRVRQMLSCEHSGGVLGTLRGWRERTLETIDPVSSDGRALLSAMCLGWRDGLRQRGLDELFSRVGVAHLVAVSGTHLMVVAMLVGRLSTWLGAEMRAVAALQLAATGGFALLCGCPPSAMRAWAMLAASIASQLMGRRHHALSALGAAALAMMLVDPLILFDLGFALSVLTVCALILLAPYVSCMLGRACLPARMPRLLPSSLRREAAKRAGSLTSALGASCTAQLAALPLVAQAFSVISPVGPIASVLLAMPATLAIALGVCAMLLIRAPPVGAALLMLAELDCKAIVILARFLASAPGSSIPVSPNAGIGAGVLLLAASLALIIAWPDVSRVQARACLAAIFVPLAVLLIAWRFFAPARIVVLDVGQGDAILVQDGPSALLVDCGPGNAVMGALARQHVLHLDGVLITHWHDDHYGGLDDIASSMGAGKVLMASGSLATALELLPWLDDDEVAQIAHGDVLRVGRFELRVVWPNDQVDGTENAHSVQLLACYADGSSSMRALLTGDAESQELASLLAAGEVGDIDLLKLGHHGSEQSLSPAQAAELDAEVSVASAGRDNEYGHPSPTCVETIEDAGSLFMCTMDAGDVDVRPARDGIVVMK